MSTFCFILSTIPELQDNGEDEQEEEDEVADDSSSALPDVPAIDLGELRKVLFETFS